MTKPDPNFIWSIADLLRGPYQPKEYGTVILPFTVLARTVKGLYESGVASDY